MDKASVYGTGDCRFESYQGQVFHLFVVYFKCGDCALPVDKGVYLSLASVV